MRNYAFGRCRPASGKRLAPAFGSGPLHRQGQNEKPARLAADGLTDRLAPKAYLLAAS